MSAAPVPCAALCSGARQDLSLLLVQVQNDAEALLTLGEVERNQGFLTRSVEVLQRLLSLPNLEPLQVRRWRPAPAHRSSG